MTFTDLIIFYFNSTDVYKGFTKTETGWMLYIQKLGVPYRVDLLKLGLSYNEALEECASIVMSNIIMAGLRSVQEKWKELEKQLNP